MIERVGRAARRVMTDPKPLRRLVAMAASWSPVSLAPIVQFRVHDFRLGLHPSHYSVDFWYAGTTNPDDHAFLTSYLHEGDVYVDVGANIGTTVIPAAQRVGTGGLVLAFEPHPRIFGYLRDNIRRNGLRNVELRNAAVGSESGVATISDERVDDENQILVEGQGLTVALTTLDQAAGHLPGIALLKIDVEGYELAVVDGAPDSLTRTACVYFELSERMAARYAFLPMRLLQAMEASGFRLFRRLHGQHLEGIDSTYALVESVENIFAIRDIADFERRTGWQLR